MPSVAVCRLDGIHTPVTIARMYRSITQRHGHPDLRLREILGLTRDAPQQAWLAVRGDPLVPGSRVGLSSLRQFMPRLAVTTWRGKMPVPRYAIVANLFNHTPTPPEAGWSVQVTQTRDFRGRGMTYDSHNGTDFAIPPGTPVVAAAAGLVVAKRNEYNRGGLKVFIDHGGGLLTSSNHLARALVEPGDRVQRGQTIALSGYSGLDALISFPWVAPHVHYNVSLGGVLVDPFAPSVRETGAPSLWRTASLSPWRPEEGAAPEDADFAATTFDPARVDALLAELRSSERRALLAAIADPQQRAWELVIESFTYPARFTSPTAGLALFDDVKRRATLDLPFSSSHFDGAVFADDIGFRHAPARGRSASETGNRPLDGQ